MSKSAVFGGGPAISTPLWLYNSIGTDEANAAVEVTKPGCLSKFIGAKGEVY